MQKGKPATRGKPWVPDAFRTIYRNIFKRRHLIIEKEFRQFEPTPRNRYIPVYPIKLKDLKNIVDTLSNENFSDVRNKVVKGLEAERPKLLRDLASDSSGDRLYSAMNLLILSALSPDEKTLRDDGIACALSLLLDHDVRVRDGVLTMLRQYSEFDHDVAVITKAILKTRTLFKKWEVIIPVYVRIDETLVNDRIIDLLFRATRLSDGEAWRSFLPAALPQKVLVPALTLEKTVLRLMAELRGRPADEYLDFLNLVIVHAARLSAEDAAKLFRRFFLVEPIWKLCMFILEPLRNPRETIMYYLSKNEEGGRVKTFALLDEFASKFREEFDFNPFIRLLDSQDELFHNGAYDFLCNYARSAPERAEAFSQRAAPELIRLIKTSDNQPARALAIKLLIEIKDPKQHASLFAKCLKDAGEDSKQRSVRVASIQALGKIGEDESVNLAVEQLSSKDFLVKETALDFLSKASEPFFERTVSGLIKSQDIAKRATAYNLIGLRGNKKYELTVIYDLAMNSSDEFYPDKQLPAVFSARSALARMLEGRETKEGLRELLDLTRLSVFHSRSMNELAQAERHREFCNMLEFMCDSGRASPQATKKAEQLLDQIRQLEKTPASGGFVPGDSSTTL